jgi:23S rRNA pseudouridine955/2504/2580 synthase
MKPPEFKNLIVFENENYVVINKPPHFSSLDDRDKTKLSILDLARSQYPDPQLCHRLDKETSGVLAIAKNPEAYRHLSIQFEKRKTIKIYHAIAVGIHHFKDKIVNLPIAVSAKGNVRIDTAEGKPSETIFDTLEIYKYHTLLACKPLTGRMHQIRIHLACVDAPIVADKMYGGTDILLSDLKRKFNLKQETEEEPLIKRVALHAYQLIFTDLDDKLITATAQYPKDIRALLTQLRKNV